MSDARLIFVSYRRDDSQHIAGRIADWIGAGRVFMDVDAIEPGADFTVAIDLAIASCRIVLVVIGKNWATVTGQHGRPRIWDPADVVAFEITAALRRSIRVVPVLVDGATLPHADELPAALRPLALRNAVRVDHATFASDVSRLVALVGTAARPAVAHGPAASPESALATAWWPPRARTSDRIEELQDASLDRSWVRWNGTPRPSTVSLEVVSTRLTVDEEIVGVFELLIGSMSTCTVVATDRIVYFARDRGRGSWLSLFYSFPSRCRAGEKLILVPLGLIADDLDFWSDSVGSLELTGLGRVTIRGVTPSGVAAFNRLLHAARITGRHRGERSPRA